MQRTSFSTGSGPQFPAHLGTKAWMPTAGLFARDRMLATNAELLMANGGDRPFEPLPERSSDRRPLYQGREKGMIVDIGLRSGGLALLGISVAMIYWLFGSVHAGAHHSATAFDYLVALLGFACASAGCILLFHGTHIFDEVEVSERWRPRR